MPTSPCTARVQWSVPTDTPSTVADSDYTIIEISLDNRNTWVELVRSVRNVEEVRVSGTQYYLRGRSVNIMMGIGEGNVSTTLTQYTAYPAGITPTHTHHTHVHLNPPPSHTHSKCSQCHQSLWFTCCPSLSPPAHFPSSLVGIS